MAAEPVPSLGTRGGSRIRIVHYEANERHAMHAHEHSSITLVLRGMVRERVGSEIQRGSALSVVVKPAGIPHSDEFGASGALTLQVMLSAADEESARSSECWPSRWRWSHADGLSRAMIRMLGIVLRVETGDGALARGRAAAGCDGDAGPEDLLFEVLGEIPQTRGGSRPPPPWLTRVRDALELESVPIRALADMEGVHPVALARQFRRCFGVSPTEYRRGSRVRRAAALLTGTRRPLPDVALEAGYADQAHLTRDLRAVTGVTPCGIRSLAARS